MTNDEKSEWVGRIGMFCVFGLFGTTVAALFHWPVDPELVKTTNTVFATTLAGCLGFFQGSSSPTSPSPVPPPPPQPPPAPPPAAG